MLNVENAWVTNHGPDDPLTMYLREVSDVEPLSRDEETQLISELRARRNWDEASELIARKLIESHLGLVITVAQKYSESGIPMLDLIEEGNFGLIRAVRSFAENPIGDFTAYASARIDEAIAKVVPGGGQ